MRLIDADDVFRFYVEAFSRKNLGERAIQPNEIRFSMNDIRDNLDNMPTIDAVPVVRCKDCKNLFDGEHNANCCAVLMEKAKWITEITVDENGYCNDGKRRDDAT